MDMGLAASSPYTPRGFQKGEADGSNAMVDGGRVFLKSPQATLSAIAMGKSFIKDTGSELKIIHSLVLEVAPVSLEIFHKRSCLICSTELHSLQDAFLS